MQLTNDNVGF